VCSSDLDKQLVIPALVKFKRLRDPQNGEYRNFGYPEYLTIPFHPDTDAYPYPPKASGMTFDGLHPSDKGNAVIARRLIKILKKY
jgi:lysophospholipase L1-like esterase